MAETVTASVDRTTNAPLASMARKGCIPWVKEGASNKAAQAR
ncbi:MAG: hypothetical protein SPF89_04170 [Sphaerochaetaceae bacterium]|nr:hypothetical protein [Spirochaetales bacterium]MDY5499281.1 hypothetical protein [Sphaerochaetaceae bacterium]